MIRDDPGRRARERPVPCAQAVRDARGQRPRVAVQASGCGVEPCRHQRTLHDEQQMAGGILAVDARAHHLAVGLAVKRGEEDRVLLGPAALVVNRGIQEVPAIRQEERPAVARVPRPVHRRDRHRRAARHCHAVQRPDGVGRKEDHAVLVPRAAPAVRRAIDRDRRPADEVDALEQGAGEERQGPVVMRPEWERGVLGSR